jgi:hypothetical protein
MLRTKAHDFALARGGFERKLHDEALLRAERPMGAILRDLLVGPSVVPLGLSELRSSNALGPKGSAREHEKDEHGNVVADYTLWTSAIDLKAKQYFFRTYDNSEIRMIDLKKMNLYAKDIVKISIEGGEVIRPINP